ncbi:hypothetical protein Nepgr_033767 [Nepenthes gracilis]|uniref:Uncharacterized protein n=1 Tax=Nepenthes gracilis TaxID=150966 RepID=A0AAD3TL83_NEPGR|nr:hypothetical protein Nepgr_033767 [Nepenthes gracilis]
MNANCRPSRSHRNNIGQTREKLAPGRATPKIASKDNRQRHDQQLPTGFNVGQSGNRLQASSRPRNDIIEAAVLTRPSQCHTKNKIDHLDHQ